jgi:hypothetical protein
MISRILAQAVQRMEEHEKKLKLLQQKTGSVSGISAVMCNETVKNPLTVDGSKLSPCKILATKSCNVVGSESKSGCSSEKNKLNKSSTDSDVVVAVDAKNMIQCTSEVCPANVHNNRNLEHVSSLSGRSNLSLGGTQNVKSVSLSPGVSHSGASFTGDVDGLVKQLEVINSIVSGDRNVCDNGSSSQSKLKHANIDAGKIEHTGLSLGVSQEYGVAKYKPKHLFSKKKSGACLYKSHGMFTLHSWDSTVNTHPIESDEWLAFLQRTMEEIMDGDVDSLQQCNFVGMVVSPLRNPGASSRVMEYVACLLSIPFVVNDVTEEQVLKIQQVIEIYIEFI